MRPRWFSARWRISTSSSTRGIVDAYLTLPDVVGVVHFVVVLGSTMEMSSAPRRLAASMGFTAVITLEGQVLVVF